MLSGFNYDSSTENADSFFNVILNELLGEEESLPVVRRFEL